MREIKADRVGNRKVLVILHDFQRELWWIGWTKGVGVRRYDTSSRMRMTMRSLDEPAARSFGLYLVALDPCVSGQQKETLIPPARAAAWRWPERYPYEYPDALPSSTSV